MLQTPSSLPDSVPRNEETFDSVGYEPLTRNSALRKNRLLPESPAKDSTIQESDVYSPINKPVSNSSGRRLLPTGIDIQVGEVALDLYQKQISSLVTQKNNLF